MCLVDHLSEFVQANIVELSLVDHQSVIFIHTV